VTTQFVIVGACSPVENHAAVTLAFDVNGDPVPDVEDTESVTTIAPPLAVDDVDTTGIATPVVTPVLQNDSDPNGNIKVNTIKTTGVLQPSNGAVIANTTNGNISYIPQAGFTGVDTYEYIICDSTNLCDTALVTIYIFNEDCSNGRDDDGDGLVDCADPDCSNFTNGGTIAGDQSLCAIYDPAQITSVSPPSGGIGGVVGYKWQSSTDGGLNWNDISGATAETYDPPVISQTTSYRRAARRFACGNWVYSNTVIKSNTNCPEICDNGRDDDGDGLIDCLDSDCSVAVLAGNDASICPGGSATLTASASGGDQPYLFIWDNNLGEGANQTASPLITTTYRVLVETASGCIGVDSMVVSISGGPSVNAGADVSICSGGSATLTASASGGSGGGYTYSWSGGLGSGANKTVSPASTTTYTVTVTDSNGCFGTDAVVVTVVADPAISAQPTGFTECVGGVQALSVTATGGTPSLTYQWQSSADNVTFSNIAGA
ncbi:MAG: Ig-like domain-containing protein, partial [Planctomycetota bacterium]